METNQEARAVFTEEMKETHTILIPMMLPLHFKMLSEILNQNGYHTELLTNTGHEVVNEGLRNVHNDTCYPALLVIGQMIDALDSGRYDPHKVAFMITQTGGGCRASNYIFLLRKALKKSGYGFVPVISLNTVNLESNPGFRLTPSILIQFLYAVILGDLMMLVSNQCRPYEKIDGETDRLTEKWLNKFCDVFAKVKLMRFGRVKKLIPQMLEEFKAISRTNEQKVKVGVVGEIYVKYSPLGNNNLEKFLLSEGAEVVVPGLLDFCLYCVYNTLIDRKLYGGGIIKDFCYQLVYRYLLGIQKKVIHAIQKQGAFDPPMAFSQVVSLTKNYINPGVKMGEGWLLTTEMAELIAEGVQNIVCTQPFGCLPNHIVGKGMIRAIKDRHPNANIVAVDYDPGASEINQQNRIKLMLANASLSGTDQQAR